MFDCWLQPASICKWLSAALRAMGLSGDLGVIEADARVGGKFCFSDKRPTGEAFHWGTYKQLDHPTRIAFTWNAGNRVEDLDDDLSLVTIGLEPTIEGCSAKLVHSMDAQCEAYVERTKAGWKNMLVHIQESKSE